MALLFRRSHPSPRRHPAAALVAALLVVLTSCAGAINEKNMEIHFRAGQRFETAKDFASAAEEYRMALVNARLADADPEILSMLAYSFGRTIGYACHLDAAETHLLEALTLEESISGPDSATTSMRLFELARLNYDQGRYARSVDFYGRAIPVAEKLGVARSDPIALADALDEYADALGRIGETASAEVARREAGRLRDANPGRRAEFVPVRYACR